MNYSGVTSRNEAGNSASESFSQRKALRLGWLFLISNLFVLLFSSLPVLVKLPDFYYTWFGLADVIRILEPLVALPFQLLIFIETGVLKYDIEFGLSKSNIVYVIVFSVAVSCYQQGAGLHSGAAMFKDAVETVKDLEGAVEQFPILENIYEYIRDVWQHLIAHYIYASGGIILAGVRLC
jgi:hypothetical protein